MTKYNIKIHHRRSHRLKGYDYAQAGSYFITVCCYDRVCLFGEVVNNEMVLNQFGKIAHDEWSNTPNIRKNIALGEFIIMPNHIHGIIQILHRGELHSPLSNSPLSNSPNISSNKENNSMNELGECNSPRTDSNQRNGEFKSPSQTIGAIVRGYKSSVTKQLNLLNIGKKVWQRDYNEIIILNQRAHHNISEYIENNTAKWAEDNFRKKQI
jgi:putative transposase